MAFTSMQNTEYPSLQLEMERDALEALLTFAYTRQCSLTSENIVGVMEAATTCQMTSLLYYCCDYLTENLNHENIFHLYRFAQLHSHAKLFRTAFDYLM
jgi:hypothetical protein